VIKARFGDRLDEWLRTLLPFLFRWRVSPNLLTVIGTLVSVVSGAAFAVGAFGWGAVLIGVGGLFDLLDGVVARQQGTDTAFGAFLDSTLDRLADMAILVGIMFHFAGLGDAGTVLLAGIALIASVLISYAKARAEHFLPALRGGFLERGERLFVLAIGAVTGMIIPALWVLAVLGTATVGYRFARAYRELGSLDANRPPQVHVGEHP
jgi:CDP-diacylglycerol--glycerol-3-phosphate 3-phosphatidyltransferase